MAAMRILPTEVVLVVAALEFQRAQLQEPPSTLTISACLADTIAAVFCCGPALSFVLRTPRPVSTEPGCSGGGGYQPSR